MDDDSNKFGYVKRIISQKFWFYENFLKVPEQKSNKIIN